MMTTYYFGNIEFGRFAPSDLLEDSTPLAIIHRVDVVQEFDVPEDAWQYYCENGFDSYVSLDAVDKNNVKYELVFKQHR
jgi:hypothetical protein